MEQWEHVQSLYGFYAIRTCASFLFIKLVKTVSTFTTSTKKKKFFYNCSVRVMSLFTAFH